MRITSLLVLAALAATASPAFAQGRGQSCQDMRANNQVGGAIVGGILGGVLGSNTAARGHRSDGTAVGAVLGGIIGAGVGGQAVPCHRPAPYDAGGYGPYGPGSDYSPNPNYGGPNYDGPGGAYGYRDGPDDYRGDRYYSAPGYGEDAYNSGYESDIRSQNWYYSELDAERAAPYNRNSHFVGAGCSEASQVTRLPDGSEIHRPVTVCHDPEMGEWVVRD